MKKILPPSQIRLYISRFVSFNIHLDIKAMNLEIHNGTESPPFNRGEYN